ncbi:MAG: hypothetical protein Q7U54_03330 [Bacteroidales bacterium]|nr:hypothetical protein [Bacteroidales bacterium]
MKKSIILMIFVSLVFLAQAQKIKLVSGNLTFLKGEKSINLQYYYDNVKVGDMDESNYIKKKVTEYNAKEPGKGDKWLENWKNDRKTRYEPKFEELFNKYLEEVNTKAKEGDADAKYTLLIKTKMIEPGFNVGVVRRPAKIDVEVEISAAGSPENKLAELTIFDVPGADAMGFDFDSGERISEAYAKLGKALAKYIVKNTVK